MTTTYNPPHDVEDWDKVRSLVEAFRRGDRITPIAVMGENALTGSHRIAAHDIAWRGWDRRGWDRDEWEGPEPVLDTVEVSEADYVAACNKLGVDHWQETPHWADWIAALYDVTEDDDLKAAIEDQR